MLDNSYTNRENAIEEVIYDFLKDCNLVEMSNQVAELYMLIGLMSKDVKLSTEEKPFVFQVMEKRLENCFTFRFTDERALLAVSIWAESAGVSIIYLWYIQAWCFKNNVQEVDFETLGLRIFPNGIFSEKDLKSVWDNQKVKNNGMESDNLVDYTLAGLSIQFLLEE
jgi:hypothetical protein